MNNGEMWQEAASALDKVSDVLSGVEKRMMEDVRNDGKKYKAMLHYWKKTARYRKDSYYEKKVGAKLRPLSVEDRNKVEKKYIQYTLEREDFEDACILYKSKLKDMRKKSRKKFLIIGPILTAVMVVLILLVDWNNLVTKFLALSGMGFTIEALCSALFDKHDAGAMTHWVTALVVCAAAAVAWTALIGRPPVTLSIILGYTVFVSMAYDIGTNSFKIIAG